MSEYTGPVAAPGEPPYYRVPGGDEDPWYEGPPVPMSWPPYGEERTTKGTADEYDTDPRRVDQA
jgi:hypothetical protein